MKRNTSTGRTQGKSGGSPVEIRGTQETKSSAKNPWLAADVKATDLTTEELAVPCVAVVTDPQGRVFAGPYYLDQLDLLRDTLRGMPRRERYEVAAGEVGFWIYRKA